jgi:hypothetical protein
METEARSTLSANIDVKVLTLDEARRIASKVAKLPKLLEKP